MSPFRYLLYSLLIILLATACNSEPEALGANTSVLGFSVDPVSQTVTLNEVGAANLSTQQASDEPRVLTSLELRSRNFDYAFLPGNMLRIEVEFTNVIGERFGLGIKQPFAFSPVLSGTSGRTVNIVSSEEPIVTDEDLGGDGILSSGETTSKLVFEVVHKNEYFAYYVEAKAVVAKIDVEQTDCEDETAIIDFPDFSLRRAIRSALNLESDTPINCGAIKTLTDVSASGVSNLEGLQFATNLTKLTLGGSVDFSGRQIDIEPLNNLINLTELGLNRMNLSDISALSNLTNLRSLDLSFNKLVDTSDLSNLTGLRDIDLSYNDELTDLSGLTNLSSLDSLKIQENNKLADISPLRNLSNLQTLDLVYSRVLVDLSGIEGLTNLKSLYLYGCCFNSNEGQRDLTPLAGLISLQELSLGPIDTYDYSMLDSLINLEQLTVQGLAKDYSDIPVILPAMENFTKLTRLTLSNLNITDITALQNLNELQFLNLSGNYISDLNPLSSLSKLNILYLQLNSIRDMAPLIANSSLGEGDDEIYLTENCLDYTEGSDDLANIAVLEDRNPSQENVSFGTSDFYFEEYCNQ